jgi:predicted MarR family transcription regulator
MIGFQNSIEVYIVFIINIRQSHKRLGSIVCNMKLDDKKNHALSLNKCII